MYDPKTKPPESIFGGVDGVISGLWYLLGCFLLIASLLWGSAAAMSRSPNAWDGPPLFGYSVLCLILAKLYKPPA